MSGAYTAIPSVIPPNPKPPLWDPNWVFPGPSPPGYIPFYVMGISVNGGTDHGSYVPGTTEPIDVELGDLQSDDVIYATVDPSGDLTLTANISGSPIRLKTISSGFTSSIVAPFSGDNNNFILGFDVSLSQAGQVINLVASGTPFSGNAALTHTALLTIIGSITLTMTITNLVGEGAEAGIAINSEENFYGDRCGASWTITGGTPVSSIDPGTSSNYTITFPSQNVIKVVITNLPNVNYDFYYGLDSVGLDPVNANLSVQFNVNTQPQQSYTTSWSLRGESSIEWLTYNKTNNTVTVLNP